MRRGFTLVSIILHAFVIAAALVAQVLAVGPLPIPHAPLTFIGAMPIQLMDVPAPPPHATTNAPNTVSSDAAPLEPPSDITPETPREPSPARSGLVEGGVPNGVNLETISYTPLPLPPPPAPVSRTPVRLSGMRPPQKVVNVDPVYPYNAKIAHVEGIVILVTTIDTRVRVTDVRVLRSAALLDQAAVDAVRQRVYTPTLLNRLPVPIIMTVTVRFTLQDR